MSDITELRKEIDEIDLQLQNLIEKRMDVSKRIGDFKASRGMPVFDAQREEEKIAELKGRASAPETAEAVERIYRAIFETSRNIQHRIAASQTGTGGCQ